MPQRCCAGAFQTEELAQTALIKRIRAKNQARLPALTYFTFRFVKRPLPGLFFANWKKLSSYLKEAGKDPTAYPTIAYHNININPDRNAALEESRRFLDEYYGPVFAPSTVKVWTAAGTPQQCVEDLLQLQRDGAKAITLRITSWHQKGQFDRLINEVLPKLR